MIYKYLDTLKSEHSQTPDVKIIIVNVHIYHLFDIHNGTQL